MARNGAPPMPRPGCRCRVPYCEGHSIESALFCADHELLWVAESGHPSYGLKPKHGKRYRRFLRRQTETIRAWRQAINQQIRRAYGQQA